jgi:isopentenyl-diphosphate delta-isomerase
MEAATQRRLYEELGIGCPLQFLFKFQYQAQFDATASEHELCSVFIGTCSEPPEINRDEILSWRWVRPDALQAQFDAHPRGKFTPWFVMEWARIWHDHREAVLALQA